jgi:SAM-dependent methyltransferase
VRVDEYERMFRLEESLWWYLGLRELLERYVAGALAGKAEARVLDAGCGTGANLRMLAKFGKAVGVDLSTDAVQFVKQRGVGEVARADLMKLPFPDAAFDVVTSVDVLYHQWVKDDGSAVAELARVAKPGGVVIVHSAALEMLRGSHDRVVLTRKRYTLAEMRRLLAGAGLSVETASYRNTLLFPIVLLKRWFDSKEAEGESDVEQPSSAVNSALHRILRFENRLLNFSRMPFGSSIVVVARKPGAAENI